MKYFLLSGLLLLTPFIVWAQLPEEGSTTGTADQEPGYNYEVAGSTKDIVEGTEYFYIQNNSVFLSISPVDGSNNGPHSIHRGAPMDVVHKQGGWDNLDWGQFLLSGSIHGSWNRPGENPDLSNIKISDDGTSVIAEGYSLDYPDIKFLVNYSILQDTAPVVQIDVSLINEGSEDFSGYLQYQIDPDGDHQRSFVPGVGDSPGLISIGWNSNYIYTGPTGDTYSAYPAHGIAWLEDQPSALMALNYLNGVWFPANVAVDDTTTITLYHITDIPESRYETAEQSIIQWAEALPVMDTSFTNNYRYISGIIEDVHGQPVNNAIVKVKNINASEVARAISDENGEWSAIVPKDVFTVTVTSLGYLQKSRSLDASFQDVLDFSVNDGFALTPIQVWAGKGKTMTASHLPTTGEEDIIMENDKIAVGISVANLDPQVRYISRGIPVDIIDKSVPEDDLDWLQIGKLSMTNDTLEDWWSQFHTLYDTVYVSVLNNDSAVVIAEGNYFRNNDEDNPPGPGETLEYVDFLDTELIIHNNLSVATTYTIKPGDYYFTAKTELINNSESDTLQLYTGDILDMDGSGQVSYVPGYGGISGDWGRSDEFTFTPSAPWFSQITGGQQSIGLIYDYPDTESPVMYGVGRWMSMKNLVDVIPDSSYSWSRKVVVKSTEDFSDKFDAVASVYNEIKQEETGFRYNYSYTEEVIEAGDSVEVTISLVNDTEEEIDGINIRLYTMANLEADSTGLFVVNDIPAEGSEEITLYLRATEGGRGLNQLQITDHMGNTYQSTFPASATGPGWYSGDNHTHSVHSDGVGTIAENVKAGYDAGLSFMSATDHNTLSQAADVEVENQRYDDMIIMTGEEVTTREGHALAYNTGTLIPWNLNTYTQQEIIDLTNSASTENGPGFMYLAHPHYPGLPWENYSVRNHTGLEVWNGFYHALHEVNSLTFKDWDSLNVLGLRLLGISNSDAHNPSIVAKNYIVAYLEEFTKEEIISVMRDKGLFYGTNGPRINFTAEGSQMGSDHKVPVDGRSVSITMGGKTIDGQSIDYIRLIHNGEEERIWNPSGSDTSLTLQVYAEPGDFVRMELKSGNGFAFSNPIWFEAGNNDASLVSISVNNEVLPDFNPSVFSYLYHQDISTTPEIEVELSDPDAQVETILPADVNSDKKEDRMASVIVMSEDGGRIQTYTIEFNNYITGNKVYNREEVTLYPVPASERLFISGPEVIQADILSTEGQQMKGVSGKNITEISLEGLNEGLYIVRLKFHNGQVIKSKISVVK